MAVRTVSHRAQSRQPQSLVHPSLSSIASVGGELFLEREVSCVGAFVWYQQSKVTRVSKINKELSSEGRVGDCKGRTLSML